MTSAAFMPSSTAANLSSVTPVGMQDITLPTLRQELSIEPASHDENGAPRWLLVDKVRNSYFTLTEQALGLIRYWQPNASLKTFANAMVQRGLDVSEDEIRGFIYFLDANHLIQRRDANGVRVLNAAKQKTKVSPLKWLLHNYLFIRLPLWQPDPWLKKVGPKLNWLFTPLMHYSILLLGLIGLLLVSRQWEQFQHTFSYFFNTEGLIYYIIALIFVKSAHELGHALVSYRHNCHVASIGVAFIVMFPVLYTDTTSAWQLRSRHKRLAIVSAGVRTELYIAMLATFLWNVVPDGVLRSVMFFIATTSWLTSLLVNTSPFMRFDGYFAFSDIFNVENLQHRAFSYGRWQLRRWLWGIDDAPPEPLRPSRARLFIGYAFATWIYRFFLFLGIALVVYHLFFKVLGILLFLVEISWFVLLPIIKEVNVWHKRHQAFQFTRGRVIGWSCALLLCLWAVLPLSTQISLPGVLRAAQNQQMYAPTPAQISQIYVHDGQRVEQGEVLITLQSPELTEALNQVSERIKLTQLSLERQAVSSTDKATSAIAEQQLQQLMQQQQGLLAQQQQLQLKAPFAGEVSLQHPTNVGRWVNDEEPLLRIVNPQQLLAEGFAEESLLNALQAGQTAHFIAEQATLASVPLSLTSIDVSSLAMLPYPELASTSGGAIAVRDGANPVPEETFYQVHFSPLDFDNVPALPPQRLSGTIVVDGEARSWLWYQLKRSMALLIRESGF